MKKNIIIGLIIVGVMVIAIMSNYMDTEIDGKTIAFLGDSLMAGYGNGDRAFDYYFKESLPNSKLINNSRSGSTITDNTGTDTIIMQEQVNTLKGEPDIIIFDGGANDIIGYGLGFLEETKKKPIGKLEQDKHKMTDPNTVLGDLEEAIVTLKEKYPDAKLYYLQLFLVDDATIDKITIDESKKPDIKSRRDELYGQIKDLCKKQNIGYIKVDDKFIETEKKYRQDDWIHLKEEGYQVLTKYIIEELKDTKYSY